MQVYGYGRVCDLTATTLRLSVVRWTGKWGPVSHPNSVAVDNVWANFVTTIGYRVCPGDFGDFLSQKINIKYTTIIGNPPYVKTKTGNLYLDFIKKCYDFRQG